MSARRLEAVGLTIFAALAIGGCLSQSLSRAPVVRFHGEAADPIGDTAVVADARVALPPDLVYASVQVMDDALRLSVRFAPRSLDPATTGAMFLVDADLDPNTGVSHHNPGAQYLVTLDAGPVREATVARGVAKADCPGAEFPCPYHTVAHAAVAVSNDEMDATVPRSAFASFDGRLNFRVIAYAILDGGRLTRTSDHMPNAQAQFIAVR